MQFKKLYETNLSVSKNKKSSDGGRIFLKKNIMNFLAPDTGIDNLIAEVFEVNNGERILVISNSNRSSDIFDNQMEEGALLPKIYNLVEENNTLLKDIKDK